MKLFISFVIFSAFIAFGFGASCTGNPPMYNGLPCATTTRYYDGQKGACGCGTGDTDPFSWQWNLHTAAASQGVYDASGSSWCGDGCFKCYEITPTGDCPYPGACAVVNSPITIMVTNRCPYIGNEVWCPQPNTANQWGYYAHFDLMDYNMAGWVDSLGWNNPVVTYRQVPCGGGGSPSCDQAAQCQCSSAGDCDSGNSTNSGNSGSSSSSTVSTSTSTTASSTTTTTSSSSSSSTASTSTTTSSTTSIPIIDDSDDSGSSSSTSTSGSSSSGSGSCTASITQTVGQTWIGGGLVNIAIFNTGSSPITRVNVNLSITNSSSWNLDFVAEDLWGLPAWAFPINPNQNYVSSGYTYENTTPEISLSQVIC